MRKNKIVIISLLAPFLIFVSISTHGAIMEAFPAPSNSISPKDEGGIFSLRAVGDKLNNVSELDTPYVAGLSVRFEWQSVEPNPGEFNWSLLDKAHELTVAKNKLLMIRVTAGMFSPAWIYKQGVGKITFHGDESNFMKPDSIAVMPVPWDEAYLAAWEKFITALGNKISGWSNVYCVQMTGGGFICEMHLPKKRASTIREWKNAGINDKTVFRMWQRIIEIYDKHIPQGIGLALNLGVPFEQSKTPELVYEYALDKYPKRVWFQQDGLQEVYPSTRRWSKMIRKAARKTVVGYQMLGGGKFLDAETGNRKIAFEHAIEDGCSYVEVYTADVRNPKWQDAMVFLANGLAKNIKKQFNQ